MDLQFAGLNLGATTAQSRGEFARENVEGGPDLFESFKRPLQRTVPSISCF
jgi:hypothetical protein